MRIKARFEFEPRDLFLGLYWNITTNYLDSKNEVRINRSPYILYPRTLHFYILFIPTIPLHISIPLYKEREP